MAQNEKVNWNSVETWQRVVAAMLATGIKPDLRQTATYFGTTYDTLENRFRKIKKEADVLKGEVSNGARGEVTAPSRQKSAPTTPRKRQTPKKDALSSVSNGRINKSTPKSSKKSGIKQEQIDQRFTATLTDEVHDPTDMSFDMDFGNQDDLLDEYV
ncbi:Hypothetical predicted protein [Lecanosticta acicola]|uniref:Uncharacterized protein n=1 Tax=Lecanosticta acicola TaxID=111012 RepID=A0AAI9E7V3_9PEZI|nr:Hypothetical predicted protein [Lecanosticta acicola]